MRIILTVYMLCVRSIATLSAGNRKVTLARQFWEKREREPAKHGKELASVYNHTGIVRKGTIRGRDRGENQAPTTHTTSNVRIDPVS